MQIESKPVIVVMIRLLSIYLVANSLSNTSFVFLVPTLWEDLDSTSVYIIFSQFFFTLVFGVLLWVSAQKIATWVSKDSSKVWLPEEKAIVSAGTFLIGIFWAFRSLSAVISQAIESHSVNYQWLIILVLSAWLLLGCKGVTKVYSQLRTAGLSHNKSFKEPDA
ncbi:MAG: hypothetical protein ACR2QW_04440 [bacterium]